MPLSKAQDASVRGAVPLLSQLLIPEEDDSESQKRKWMGGSVVRALAAQLRAS